MNYKGTCSWKQFVGDCNKVMTAFNKCDVLLPPLDGVDSVFFGIKGSGKDAKLILDMSELPVISLNNVEWDVQVSGTITTQEVVVENGKVVVRLNISNYVE